jgi:hypothetical protein
MNFAGSSAIQKNESAGNSSLPADVQNQPPQAKKVGPLHYFKGRTTEIGRR